MGSIRDVVEVKRTSQTTFQSIHPLQRNGNVLPIAYGGFVLGQCINSACQTVPSSHHIYSAFATYLGPTTTSDTVTYTVEDIRTTRTFATRQVIATQIQKGETRKTMIMLADFHIEEPALLEYSPPTKLKYKPAEETPIYRHHLEKEVKAGRLSKSKVETYNTVFPLMHRYPDYDLRYCVEGLGFQRILGIDGKRPSENQDHLDITEKTSAIWHKSSSRLKAEGEKAGLLAFITDGALAFIPLLFSSKFIDESGACSSMEASIRFHTHKWETDQWLLSEQYTEAAAQARSFSTFRTYDESGRLISTMSQMGILRPPANPAKL